MDEALEFVTTDGSLRNKRKFFFLRFFKNNSILRPY